MTKQIPLTQGKFALVDDEDYDFLMQWKWHFNITGYACREIRKDKKAAGYISMHRNIINTTGKMEVDHINGDKLDNRKENLRIATTSQNLMNKNSSKNKKYTKYKGIYKTTKSKWRVLIRINGKNTHMGCFESEEDAALAYNEAAIKYFGEYARLNIIAEN